MSGSKIDVGYVAELARLELSAEEKALFQQQLEKIVDYVNIISKVDVENVEPMMHGKAIVNALREDEVKPSLERELALRNAPATMGHEYLLPKVVEGAES